MNYLAEIIKLALDQNRVERGIAHEASLFIAAGREWATGELMKSGSPQSLVKAFVDQTARRMPEIFEQVEKTSRKTIVDAGTLFSKRMGDLLVEASGRDLKPNLVRPTRLRKILDNDSFDGATFKDHLEHQKRMTAVRVRQISNAALSMGKSPAEVKALVEQQVFARAARALTATVRTFTNNTINAAIWETGEANSDLTRLYRLKVTLDTRTSMICISYGQRKELYPYRAGSPRPPFHFNCRTLIMPVVVGREGEDLPDEADAWLRSLDEKTQVEILGPKRAALFRAGRLNLVDLIRSDNSIATVAEIRGVATLIEMAEPGIVQITPGPAITRGRAHSPLAPRPRKERVAPAAPDPAQVGSLVVPDFSTVRQAEQWLSREFPNIKFDFKGTRIETMNPTVKEFVARAREWPLVAEKLEYFGTYRGENAPRRARRKWNPREWAHASQDGKRLGINPAWYGNPAKFKASLELSERSGWHPKGATTFETVISHEFGHHVQNWMQNAGAQAFTPFVRSNGSTLAGDMMSAFKKKNPRTSSISKYAGTNDAESWAESFMCLYHQPEALWVEFTRNQKRLLDAIRGRRVYKDGEWRFADELADLDERRRSLVEADRINEITGLFG